MESFSRDVLPAGVRRRLSRRDGLLPLVLMGELMAGMALGVVWPTLTAATAPAYPQTTQTTTTAVTTVPVVPLAPPAPAAIPVVLHPPRNPFGTPAGIDASLQTPVVSQQGGGAPAPVLPAPPAVAYAPPPPGYVPPAPPPDTFVDGAPPPGG